MKLRGAPWAIHSPSQVRKVQDGLSENLREGRKGRLFCQFFMHVQIGGHTPLPCSTSMNIDKLAVQLLSQICWAVCCATARCLNHGHHALQKQESVTKATFSAFTSEEIQHRAKWPKPFFEWCDHSKCQASHSSLYNGTLRCFWKGCPAAKIHLDPVKIGQFRA